MGVGEQAVTQTDVAGWASGLDAVQQRNGARCLPTTARGTRCTSGLCAVCGGGVWERLLAALLAAMPEPPSSRMYRPWAATRSFLRINRPSCGVSTLPGSTRTPPG